MLHINYDCYRKHSILSSSSWRDNCYASTINAIRSYNQVQLRWFNTLRNTLHRKRYKLPYRLYKWKKNSEKDFDLLKPLIDFSLGGACSDKPFEQPSCKDYSHLHHKELRWNCWLSPSSNLWEPYETTCSDCATTLPSSMKASNQKHISMITNTSNASLSAIMIDQFQA